MKKLFWFEFSLLVTIDLIYLLALIVQYNVPIDIRDIGISLSIANLLLGPLQLIPGLILLFKKDIRTNPKFLVYLLLAFITIIVFTINININLILLIILKLILFRQAATQTRTGLFVYSMTNDQGLS